MEDRVEKLSRNEVFYLLCLPFRFLQLALNKVIIHRNHKFNKQQVQETQKKSWMLPINENTVTYTFLQLRSFPNHSLGGMAVTAICLLWFAAVTFKLGYSWLVINLFAPEKKKSSPDSIYLRFSRSKCNASTVLLFPPLRSKHLCMLLEHMHMLVYAVPDAVPDQQRITQTPGQEEHNVCTRSTHQSSCPV